MDHQNFFKADYTPYVVKWGRLTNIIGAVFLFIPCIVLSIMGHHPLWGAVGVALVIRVSSLCVGWFAEPISYYPSLGAAGTYMGCLCGSMSNMRLPASLVAQEAAGVKNGSEEGVCISTIGVAVSVVVNLVLLTLTVVCGTQVINALPEEIKSLLNYLLPALFGSLLANNIIKSPKLAAIGVPLAVFMTFGNSMGLLDFMPKVARTPVVMIVSIFGTIALGFVMLLKKQQKEA